MTALVATAAEYGAMVDRSELSQAEVERLDENVQLLVARGERIRRQLLEHVHRTARPHTTPDQLALSRELADYRALLSTFPKT